MTENVLDAEPVTVIQMMFKSGEHEGTIHHDFGCDVKVTVKTPFGQNVYFQHITQDVDDTTGSGESTHFDFGQRGLHQDVIASVAKL